MKTVIQKPCQSLVELLRKANRISPQELERALMQLSIKEELRTALASAARGDTSAVNDWVFSLPYSYPGVIAWLAPVKNRNGTQRYAWMVGHQSALQEELCTRFQSATKVFEGDPLLMQQEVPKPLRFIVPDELSLNDAVKKNDYDRFAIFQTGKQVSSTERLRDIDQRMMLNASYLVDYRRNVIERARRVGVNELILGSFEKNLELIAHVHAEGHNRGHFMGGWPFDSRKKECLLYEAVEEYRACVTSIRQAENMGFSEEFCDSLALSVFLVRCLGYGLDAYLSPDKRRTSVREVSVGAMFFGTLFRGGAIRVTKHPMRLDVDPAWIRHILVSTLKEIHDVEQKALELDDLNALRDLARKWYGVAFPNGEYAAELLAVYEQFSRILE